MRLLANLKEGDLVSVVFHDRLPLPEVDELIVIRESERQRLAKAGASLSGNKGWLVMESDLFKLINELEIGKKPKIALPNNYIINLTLLSVTRKRNKKWYDFRFWK